MEHFSGQNNVIISPKNAELQRDGGGNGYASEPNFCNTEESAALNSAGFSSIGKWPTPSRIRYSDWGVRDRM
jgi:hypothetical protein